MTSLAAAALLLTAQSQAITLEDALRTTLGAARLTPQTARFDASILPFYRQGEFQTPFARAAYEDPWRIPFLSSAPRTQLKGALARPMEQIGILSRMLGDGSSRELAGNPIQSAMERTKGSASLTAALERLKKQGLIVGAVPQARGVPDEVQRAAALIIEASLDAHNYRSAAFANAPDAAILFKIETTQSLAQDDAALGQRRLGFARKVEMSYLYSAAQEISAAATEAQKLIGPIGQSVDYDFQLDTTWGRISLTGRTKNEHVNAPYFVAIDTGGDDLWVNSASNRSWDNWVSVCIDTAGRDTYVSHSGLRSTRVNDWPNRTQRTGMGPAGAAFGAAVLVDADGDDIYRSAQPGLGSAIFGAGVLLDLKGKDSYEALSEGLGFGRFGIGILEDAEGNDTYEGQNQIQGCGFVRGVGALLDRDGDDVYLASSTVVDFPSAQSAEHNLSMAQGAGVGFRADYLTGKSLAGGIGILFDEGGDDRYEAGVFGQGIGYWMGMGILWDEKGADSYRSHWYGQGAAAHFSVGVLQDFSGSDSYFGGRFLNQGAGHDFGFGFLIDNGGDDRYTAGAVSAGAASENGIGVLVDAAGEDIYETGGISLGYCAEAGQGSLRERALTLGVLLDLGGKDDYRGSAPWAQNGRQSVNWRQQNSLPEESQLGIFADR